VGVREDRRHAKAGAPFFHQIKSIKRINSISK